jgi:hypothetical protein
MAQHFTHFVDLNKYALGPRTLPASALSTALAYLEAGPGRTDVLLMNLEFPASV